MKVIFAGGVTGGHIAPGVALAEAIVHRAPGSEILFASVANEVEDRMIARRGFDLVRVAKRTSGLVGAAAHAPAALVRAWRTLASSRPDVVVGLGGGASWCMGLAAVLMRTPLILLEQNAIPGRATRLLSRAAAQVCCQFQSAAAKVGGRAAFTGSPLRAEIVQARTYSKAESRAFFDLAPELPTLLVMGGSQGAHAVNRVMMAAAGALAGRVQVIHIAGQDDSAAVTHAYHAAGLAAHVSIFLDPMHLAYAAADLALSRAGATSLAELAATGVPAVLVPYPHAKDDHQRANARDAVEQGWAVLAEQAELDAGRAAELIRTMLGDKTALGTMAQRALASVRRDAARIIVDVLLELSSGGKEAVPVGAE